MGDQNRRVSGFQKELIQRGVDLYLFLYSKVGLFVQRLDKVNFLKV
jgi:hypothetical protein